MRKFIWLMLSIVSPAVTFADTFSFSATPNGGDISGAQGQTVGWGYSITNNSTTDWLGTLNLSVASPFQNGFFTFIFDFPVIAPGATATESFDQSVPQGLYEFTWDVGAPVGFVNSGLFALQGGFYGDEADA